MRTDRSDAVKSFRHSTEWAKDPFTQLPDRQIDNRYTRGRSEDPTNGTTKWHSFSGHERNRFFLSTGDGKFRDASSLAGIDNEADGRCWVRWDFDHDGRIDIALVNANYPLLNLYHNQSADLESNQHFIAVRIHGANESSDARSGLSNRDAFGAVVRAELGGTVLTRMKLCGEGFAAQNSGTILIGIGEHTKVDRLEIGWPSGRETSVENVPAGMLITGYETRDVIPEGVDANDNGFELVPYRPRRRIAFDRSEVSTRQDRIELSEVIADHPLSKDTKVILLTTTATWCEACHRQQPQFKRLRKHFGSTVELFGVPVDPIETSEVLEAFVARTKPPYTMLTGIADKGREAVVSLIQREANVRSIPCTVAVDRSGRVLQVFLGVPNVSEVGSAMRN